MITLEKSTRNKLLCVVNEKLSANGDSVICDSDGATIVNQGRGTKCINNKQKTILIERKERRKNVNKNLLDNANKTEAF